MEPVAKRPCIMRPWALCTVALPAMSRSPPRVRSCRGTAAGGLPSAVACPPATVSVPGPVAARTGHGTPSRPPVWCRFGPPEDCLHVCHAQCSAQATPLSKQHRWDNVCRGSAA